MKRTIIIIIAFNNLNKYASSSKITKQGNFLPSSQEMKYLKYFLLSDLSSLSKDKNLDNVPIFPYNYVSAVVLDDKFLSELFQKLITFETLVSNLTDIDKYMFQYNNYFYEPLRTLKLPEDLKIATLYSADTHFENCSTRDQFLNSLTSTPSNIESLQPLLDKLLPAKNLKAYEVKANEIQYHLFFDRITPIPQNEIDMNEYARVEAALGLMLYIPYTGSILEKFNSDFGEAEKKWKSSLKQEELSKFETKLKAFRAKGIRGGFGIGIWRNTFIQKSKDKSGNYNFTFKNGNFSEKKDFAQYDLRVSFVSFLNFRPRRVSQFPDDVPRGFFSNLGLGDVLSIEKISSAFEEQFGSIRLENNSTRKSKWGWRRISRFLLLGWVLLLVTLSLYLAYYYRGNIAKLIRPFKKK